MGAEMTATMIIWPKPCGHGGMVLELVEHFRPYWLRRRGGRQIAANVPERGHALCTGLSLARSPSATDTTTSTPSDWTGRRVTVLRYAGSILTDSEIEAARAAGVLIELVDVDGGCTERSA